ncbi:MAG: HAD hydrolase family protein [Chlorobi bacterium]|nr:HAD hydrolase family protein [Chlorobiota bacterium]
MRFNNLTSVELVDKLDVIKIYMFDLDGVLLKNSEDKENIYRQMTEFCNAQGIENRFAGIITAGDEDALTTKLDELENCFVLTSSLNKEKLMREKLNQLELDFNNLFYMGDDILDLPLLQKAGISSAPSNARREVKRAVDIVLDEEESYNILDTILRLSRKKI